MKIFPYSVLLFSWLAFGQNALAQNKQEVVLFKNNSAFVVQQQVLKTTNGKYETADFPVPALGTYWIEGDVKTLRFLSDTVSKNRAAANSIDLLKANLGKTVKVFWLQDEKELTAEGRIQKVLDDHLLLKTDLKWISLDLNGLKQIDFLSAPSDSVKERCNSDRLQIEFKTQAENQPITTYHLQRGVNWAPNYRLELRPNQKARLTLRANIMTDDLELKDATVYCTVGYPNFLLANVNDPLCSKQDIGSFLSSLPGGSLNAKAYLTNSMAMQMQSNMAYSRANEGMRSYEPGSRDFEAEETIENVDGRKSEDLYFYTLKSVSLPKRGRAYYNLFATELEYKDLFEVDLPSYTQGHKNSKHQVWHSVQLKNATSNPWTTAGVMVVNKDESVFPQGQDLLTYTAPGGTTSIKLTVAPDIRVTENEKEVSRTENIKIGKNQYADEITMEGEIVAKNYRDVPVKVKIKRTLRGKAEESSEPWQVQNQPNAYNALSTPSQVDWEIEIAPGEETIITYTYTLMIAR